jgi:SAM-dependent methyltransferase
MTPSPFVVQWAPWVAANLAGTRDALDLAIGRGRHVGTLGAAGFDVYGVDRDWSALRDAVAQGTRSGIAVKVWCGDLTAAAPLPGRRFDLVLVTRYLQRNLMEGIGAAVRPGGFLIYETFLRDQVRHRRGPTSPDHLLVSGELRSSFERFTTIFYDEVNDPEELARLVARREA